MITLSPVHVGSGQFLQNNTDFVSDFEDEDSFLYVIEPKKILAIIGEERIDAWVMSIENGQDIKSFLNKRHPQGYSSRKITNYAAIKQTDTLKECIHNGMGLAYIPGSSIKGAIRTAVLTALVPTVRNKERKIDKTKRDEFGNPIQDRNGKISIKADAKKIEQEIFGFDPNHDIFRYIQVGDACFEKDCEVAVNLINLNIRESKDDLIDKSKHQVVEAIGIGEEAFFQLKINSAVNQWANSQSDGDIKLLPQDIQSVFGLFDLVNNHTKKLIEDEIDYWQDVDKSGSEGYIEKLQDLLAEAEQCKPGKECVLRIGHASGWRFITGAWTENLTNFDDLVVPVSRPKNYNYRQYDFPKSRRLGEDDSDVFGFVKLSVE